MSVVRNHLGGGHYLSCWGRKLVRMQDDEHLPQVVQYLGEDALFYFAEVKKSFG